jgi:hypothetical protein
MPQHAKEGLFDGKVEIVEMDAIHTDAAFEQGARSIVIPAGQSERELRHGAGSGYS